MYRLEKTNSGPQVVIEGFDKGIAESPYLGIGDMRNIDPMTIPKEGSVAMAPSAMITQGKITSVTFTVDPATEILTYNGTVPLEVNTAITVANSGGALPAGMSADTAYYVTEVLSSTTFKISEVSAGGATLNITGAGTGTNSFSTINMGTPKYIKVGGLSNLPSILIEGSLNYFLLDSNGRCWIYNNVNFGNTNKWVYMHNLLTEGSLSLKSGNGLIIWKNWVFVFETSTIRVIPLINAGLSNLAFMTIIGSWNDWEAVNSNLSHYALIGQDDTVYFANNHAVGSFLEVTGERFAPSTGRTVADGATTNGSKTITSATIAFTEKDIGAEITGVGIPADTVILSINSATSAEMSKNATITDTGVTFTIPQSYTYNNEALDIPSNDEVTCLAELGTTLLIGGKNNKIYPWDRISPSFNYPIFLSENYVSRMVTVNTTAFLFIGRRGRIYITNGSNVNLYWKIPDHLSGTVNPTFVWTDAIFARNLIFFGVRCLDPAGTTINQFGGVWALTTQGASGWLINKLSYDTYSGYASAFEQNLGASTSDVVGTSGIFVSNTGYGIFMGWNDGTNGGVDKGSSLPYVGGQAIITSDMIPVGTFLEKRTFENVEFKTTVPLVTSESVAIYYRKNLSDSFVIVPITQGGGVGEISGIGSVNFEDAEWVQLQAILTSTASSPSFVRLREMRLK